MTETKLNIELLYFDDCPSWKNALESLKKTLHELGLSPTINLVRVETDEEAVKYQFVGSPTIRVNGVDLFPTGQNDYVLGCRVYRTRQGLNGWPTEELLRERLEPIMNP